MPLCKLTFACFFYGMNKRKRRMAAGGRCVICHSWVYLATPRTSSRSILALVPQCSTTRCVTLTKDTGLVRSTSALT